MIALEQVEKTYASGEGLVQALSGVSFALGEGECWGIVGPSGAGKSTLLRLMALLEEPTRGRVVLDGVCFAQSSPREKRRARQKIATVFQDCRLLSRRTVAQNAALPLQMQRLPRQEIAQRVEESLWQAGIAHKAGAYPAQLSGGQRQRAAIARALAQKPRLLLCDEPTSALDPQSAGEILELLRQINEGGVTMAVITHDMNAARALCPHTALLREGKLTQVGRTAQVLEGAFQPFAPLERGAL